MSLHACGKQPWGAYNAVLTLSKCLNARRLPQPTALACLLIHASHCHPPASSRRSHSTDREVAAVALLGFVAYQLAEGLHLSGIFSVFFCGIVMSHYTWHAMSSSARVVTGGLGQTRFASCWPRCWLVYP